MDFLNPKCCDLAEKANEQLKEICSSYVYGNDTDCFLYIVDNISRLYSVDQNTGVATGIGAVGFAGVTDIAWDGSTLYGITGNQLISINTTTGAGTLIGNHGTGSNALESDASGVLYMMGGNNLYTLNKVTAVATLVGPMGPGFFSSGDLAFDASGNLYGSFSSGNLGRIDTVTGAAANIGSFGLVNPVWGLDFCDGILYGITNTGQLLTISTSTGAATPVANTGVNSVFGMTSVETRIEIPCEAAELPAVEPIFTVRYGDEIGDFITKNDVQCICITACNPYKNLGFRDVTVMITEIKDPNGNSVDPKNFLFKPSRLVCFGDLAPCDSKESGCGCGHNSCASREFVLVTRDAESGPYTISFEYCFDVEFGSGSTYTFELEVV